MSRQAASAALFLFPLSQQSYGLWDHDENILAKRQLEEAEPPALTESADGAELLPPAEKEVEEVGKVEALEAEAEPKGIRSRFRKKKAKKRSKELKEQAAEGTVRGEGGETLWIWGCQEA